MPRPAFPLVSSFSSAMNVLKQLSRVTPKERTLTLGVDIGSTAVKALALGPRRGSGPRSLVAKQVVPVNREEPDPVEAVKTAVSALQLPVRSITLSVSGPWVVIRVVEMPVMSPAEVKQALPFEAQRFLPFNIQDVVIDGELLGPSEEHKIWVLIVACKRELLDRRLDCALRAGYDVALIDVDALALVNAYLTAADGREPQGMTALMNVGGQLTSLVVFHRAIPYLVRDLPWGGDKLIRSIAEQQKREPDAVLQEFVQGALSPESLAAVKAACESLVTELQLSFDYCENRFGQPPDTVLVTGGLAQSPSFLEALKGHLTQPVSAWTPLAGLSPQFAVAYGLALRTD